LVDVWVVNNVGIANHQFLSPVAVLDLNQEASRGVDHFASALESLFAIFALLCDKLSKFANAHLKMKQTEQSDINVFRNQERQIRSNNNKVVYT